MSKSQKQTPKQGNTLFSYFSKTPKKDATPQKTKDVLSPRRSPNNKSKTSPKSNSKTSSPTNGDGDFAPGDVVWAKLAGYPWWPSLVCNHPTANTHFRAGKKPDVHVQFFDSPPSRAWIKASNVKPYKGSQDAECQRGGQFYTLNREVLRSAEEADKALKLVIEDRMKLVVHLQPSEDEEEEEDEIAGEMMDLDPDIFDAEMSDENDESIKENMTEKTEKSDTASSPSKKEGTPRKKRTRNSQQQKGKPKRRRIMQPDSAEEDSGLRARKKPPEKEKTPAQRSREGLKARKNPLENKKKTSAQRSRERRAKLKADPVQYELAKQKDLERSRKNRLLPVSDEEAERRRERARIRQQQCRERKKAAKPAAEVKEAGPSNRGLQNRIRSKQHQSPTRPISKKNADRCKEYRERLKADPVKYDEAQQKDRERSRRSRALLQLKTEEEKATLREKGRLRQQRRRARLKADKATGFHQPTPKPRKPRRRKKQREVASAAEQRLRWKLQKQRQRKKWTAQELHHDRERARAYYYWKLEQKKQGAGAHTDSSIHQHEGEDFKPSGSESDDDDSASSGVDENEVSEASDGESASEPDSPVKSSKKKAPAKQPLTPSSVSKPSFQASVSSATKSKLSLFSAPEATSSGDGPPVESSTFLHNKLEFLQPDKIRDANKKRPNDPDYDPRTLYIPESFLNKQTPAMRQWWTLKEKHFDTVLFFKMGKFYELFHMDSTTGVEQLGLMYMKGEHAHSGFPEIAYSRYADALLQKGYKVARIEQTETPEMCAERCREMVRSTKFDKVVRREICQVSTQGIRTFSQRDGDVGVAQPSYLLALCEKESPEGAVFGVCFVDTSIGTFHVGQFSDDRHCSRLRTVFAHHTPAQILFERGRMSAKSMQLINGYTVAVKEGLSPGKEFWESGKTLKTLLEEDYFKEEGEEFEWPGVIKAMVSDTDALGLTAAEDSDLAVRAIGAVVWYLQYCLIDHEVLSMKKFEQYQPPDKVPEKQSSTFNKHQRNMVLDGVTLFNLEVTENASTGGSEGTLLEQLDTCSTPFGKRLLKQWVCAPLCQPASVNERLDAVEALMEMPDIVAETTDALKKMPDLERLLSRIHSLGSANRSKNHPDGRAILYEEVTYSKRKIEDFLSLLGGFKSGLKIAKKFSQASSNFSSRLLKQTVVLNSEGEEGHFPDITEDLEFFDKAFNHEKARKDGVIVPSKGVDEDYDEAVAEIKQTDTELHEYLDKQKQRLGCKTVVYWGTGKNRFQMEVPESVCKRVPEEYELMSSKKGAKRYRTKVIEDLLAQMLDAEDRKDVALKDIMRRIFHSFDERYTKWSQATACLSVVDVLLALTRYSRCGEGNMCRPQLILPTEKVMPFLEVREGRHPCVGGSFSSGDFIPNDTVIGMQDDSDDANKESSASRVVMVTGPNMGGKSTLMRQTGLIVILAQLGCYVPAEICRLTPVDRIFTRLGASDRIMSGESTFFVELSETSAILQHATQNSLVLMDELGRGTATYDGTAIAYAVVGELSQKLQCRSLFSTHYHSLVDLFAHDLNVRTGHMACMVENEVEDDPSQETITFLYKFSPGACPKSYGFNAARLASIPEEIIGQAIHKAKEFESNVEQLRLLGKIWRDCTAENVKDILKETEDLAR